MCEYLKQAKQPVHMAFTNRAKSQVDVIKHIKSDREAKPNVVAKNQPRAVVEAAIQLLAFVKAKRIIAADGYNKHCHATVGSSEAHVRMLVCPSRNTVGQYICMHT